MIKRETVQGNKVDLWEEEEWSGGDNGLTGVCLKYTAYFYENIYIVPVYRHNENNFLILKRHCTLH